MLSPTGSHEIRSDGQGDGHYGASRGGRKHTGVDYVCKPGQGILSPIPGVVLRIARPYRGQPYSGLVIVGEDITVKMFYFKPLKGIVGRTVAQGEPIGIAQDISAKEGHAGMLPHIHIEVSSINPALLMPPGN